MSLENEPRPSMREIVLAEIEAWSRQNEHDEAGKIANYLNNFPGRLLASSGKSFATLVAEKSKHGHPPDQIRKLADEKKQKLFAQGYTEKRLKKSLIEFDQDIDTAIKQSGVDRAKLLAIIDSCVEKGGWPQRHVHGNLPLLNDLILPVYIALREMGYSHRDLY